jgi:hypothetical protein
MRHASWTPGLPFELYADIGLRGGWLLVQKKSSNSGMMFSEQIDVAVAEFTPNNQPANQVCDRILLGYGTPSRIYVGSDTATRSIVDGTTATYIFRQKFGAGCPIIPIQGDWADKHLQYVVASPRILNNLGQRRFCVAEKFQQHDKANNRGLLDMFARMTFPDQHRADSSFFERNKDKNPFIDICDAFLYGQIGSHPPRMIKTARDAA